MKLLLFAQAIVILFTLVACVEAPQSLVDTRDSRYFEETDHTVQGEFLHFFYIYGGEVSLGYPLSEEIVVEGWRVQYFEKGRLEYHPENEPAYRVTVGWLGNLLHRRRPPIPPNTIPGNNAPDHKYFPQTGHTISGDFLAYFETHGGSVRFGWPISEPFIWQGQFTQDFQSARFFWTPNRQPRVTLENIGEIHLKRKDVTSEYK